MRDTVRIVLYVVLAVCTLVFGSLFFRTYSKIMGTQEQPAEPPAEEQDPTGQTPMAARNPSERVGNMMVHGLLGGAAFLGLALLAARDVSKFLETRAERLVSGDFGEAMSGAEYEQAEQAWGKGEYLEAIQLLREYHQKRPRQVHVCIRIAEIYEQDMGNYLAAALEYEEVIKHRLPPERWGWAAIHLANLYSGKLNKPDQAIALLKRIVHEQGGTAAARKARERLIAQGIMEETPPSSADPADGDLPPGFSRKK